MTVAKKMGIWMDHANAHLMEYTEDHIETRVIDSKFTHEVKGESLGKSENVMHNKEQHQQSEYYKRIGDEIRNCEEVVLFGPTNAKNELLNTLKADTHFSKIKIEVKQTDKLTEHQEHAFVREYFFKD